MHLNADNHQQGNQYRSIHLYVVLVPTPVHCTGIHSQYFEHVLPARLLLT